jgi:hypothetical protein
MTEVLMRMSFTGGLAAVLLCGIFTPTAEAQHPFRVKVHDTKGTPVKSVLHLLSEGDKPKRLGPNDQFGVYSVTQKWEQGNQIQVTPERPTYFPIIVEITGDDLDVPISEVPKGALRTLITKGELLQSEDPAWAALYFNEAVSRARKAGDKNTSTLEAGVYRNLGQALKAHGHGPKETSVVFDLQQSKVVMSDEFVNSVKVFQRSKGLIVNGIADFQTLSALNSPKKTLKVVTVN